MTDWEAKYKALAAGITDPRLIEHAEMVVARASSLSTTSGCPFGQVVEALLKVICETLPPKKTPHTDEEMALWSRGYFDGYLNCLIHYAYWRKGVAWVGVGKKRETLEAVQKRIIHILEALQK